MRERLPGRIAAPVHGRIYGRYVMASAGALAVDLCLFLALLRMGVPAMAASALGYGGGIVAHWLLSTRFVFAGGVAADGAPRARQKGLFVATALIGLSITALIVGMGEQLGIDPRLAKVAAVAIAFQATYVARRLFVFRT